MAKRRGLYKVGDIWYLSYARNGKIVRKSTGQRIFRVAQQILQAAKTDIVRGTYSLDRKEAPFFEEYADDFLEYYSKPNKRSWKRDITSINHLKEAFSGKRLDEITREDIDRYKVKRRTEKSYRHSPTAYASINRELACLKTMFNRAMESGNVDRNPVAGRGIMFRENNKVERILSITEEARLYEVCRKYLPRYYFWIVFTALNTGMRKGEILTLEWRDIDLVNKTINIRPEIAKSGKPRTTRINQGLTLLLENIKKETFKDKKFVFFGTNPIKDIRTGFSKAKGLAGIDPKFRFHDLRHTVASRLVTENNVDLVTAAKILGHSSTRMLERYTHTKEDIEMSAMETLNGVHEVSQLHSNCIVENLDKSAILISRS